jgi:thiol:disulfide interchange protein DsbC
MRRSDRKERARRSSPISVLAPFFATVAVVAAPVAADEAVLTKEELVARHPELRSENVSDSPIDALYEVQVRGAISYVTTDGRYLIRGEIIDLESRENLTERRRAANRAAQIHAIDPRSAIVFSPTNGIVRHRITVFTDIDCGYCRQLHRDIAAVNALGIEVRYVSYPRTGPDSDAWTKAERVWCAADRNDALTKAKLGADIAATEGCSSTPVAEHYELGRRIGLTGTPGVYAEDGTELGGYVAPADLIELLDKRAATQ